MAILANLYNVSYVKLVDVLVFLPSSYAIRGKRCQISKRIDLVSFNLRLSFISNC